MDSQQTFPLLYECGEGDKKMTVNLLDKALKFTNAGMEDSVKLLVSTVIAMTRAAGAI
jgi:hypothetical protein